MNKDLNFADRYRVTRKKFQRAALGGFGLMMVGLFATPLIAFELPIIPMVLVILAGVAGSLGGMSYIVLKAETRQEEFMAQFYGSLGISRNKTFDMSEFSDGSLLDEFNYTFPDGRRGLVSVIGTGENSEPRVVFAENASAKILEGSMLGPAKQHKEISE